MHCVNVGEGKPSWQWNKNVDIITFSPSIHIRTGHYVPGFENTCFCNHDDDEFPKCSVCHSIITNNMIAFCGDSTHHLSGQIVPLPDLPEGYN